MRRDLPPLGWLRSFAAAADHLSFTAAARDLNMTQSAVSQQIRSLETYLGRNLFHRRPRGLELTEAGLAYLPVVREAFATLARGTRAVTGETERTLNIRANLTFAVHWLAPRLARFRARHPGLRLNVMAEIWDPPPGHREIDLEIRFALQKPDGPGVTLLRRDAAYPVAAPDLRVTDATLPAAALYDCANLLSNWHAWAESRGHDWSGVPVTYASTFTFCLSVTLAGGGVMLGHDMICAELLASGALVRPVEGDMPMKEAYYLILPDHAAEIAGALEFADWLRQELARDHSGREATQAYPSASSM